MRDRDVELVYSSDQGDLRRRQPRKGRKGGQKAGGPRPAAGTRIKVRRETSGRRGKAVTTISEIPLSDAEIKALAVELKRRCGVGGTAKHGVIELQGDHRDKVLRYLQESGHEAVAAGG